MPLGGGGAVAGRTGPPAASSSSSPLRSQSTDRAAPLQGGSKGDFLFSDRTVIFPFSKNQKF
jgi:hypothetical protein